MRPYSSLIVAAFLLGCTTANPAYDGNPGLPDECREGIEVTEIFSQFPRPEKLDVLFIMDGSGDDTDALQELFADAVGPLSAVLRENDLDVRAGVARSHELGLAGPGTAGDGCDGNSSVVADLADASWADTLRCNLRLGAQDPAFEEPLQIVSDLLAEPEQGFPRADARLLVVVATRDDDCSSEVELTQNSQDGCDGADLLAVREVVEGWNSHHFVALAVFAGPASQASVERRTVCNSTIGSAYPGNRLFAATEYLGAQGYFHSVCTDEVSFPLASVVADVANAAVTLCPESDLTHEPLQISASADGDSTPVALGEGGFVYQGPTRACENGAIRFAGDALRGLDEVEVVYCTPDE